MSRISTPPQHGERRCYMTGCRLPECRAANAANCKRYRNLRHQHGTLRVDAAPFAAKVRRYAQAGWSRLEIAEYAQVPQTTIVNLISGKLMILNPDTAKRLGALPDQPSDQAGKGFLDATGTRRRAQALFRIGYTTTGMAAEVGLDSETVSRILNGRVRFVTGATARKMTALYIRQRWIPGPCGANRTRGVRRGWHGPLAWDAATIDDPAAQPDVCEPYSPPAKNGRDSLRMVELEHLLSLGESEAVIARQMGASEAYIHDLAVVIRNRRKTDLAAAA